MYKKAVVFIVCFVLSFGAGYLFLSGKSPNNTAAKIPAANTDKQGETSQSSSDNGTAGSPTGAAVAADKEGQIFVDRGCIACHSVSALNVKGGQVGPDLSQAYVNVESKHGVKLEDFLQKPNSAVMSGVLGAKPLTDDELKSVIAALKAASEKSAAK